MTLSDVSISLHCWQGDDVGGFENAGEELGGGLAVTGNYPGKARNADELRADLDKTLSPDSRHASPEPARLLCRDRRQARGSQRTAARSISQTGSTGPKPTAWAWISIPRSSPIPRRPTASRSRSHDAGIRKFWIEHGIACRKIGAASARSWARPA